MPKKNYRSLFRGSKIRLSFFIQTGKNLYLTSSRHRLVEGHSPEGQEPAAFFLPSCKKRKPRGTCDAAGLLLRRRLPTLPLAQYHRRDEA